MHLFKSVFKVWLIVSLCSLGSLFFVSCGKDNVPNFVAEAQPLVPQASENLSATSSSSSESKTKKTIIVQGASPSASGASSATVSTFDVTSLAQAIEKTLESACVASVVADIKEKILSDLGTRLDTEMQASILKTVAVYKAAVKKPAILAASLPQAQKALQYYRDKYKYEFKDLVFLVADLHANRFFPEINAGAFFLSPRTSEKFPLQVQLSLAPQSGCSTLGLNVEAEVGSSKVPELYQAALVQEFGGKNLIFIDGQLMETADPIVLDSIYVHELKHAFDNPADAPVSAQSNLKEYLESTPERSAYAEQVSYLKKQGFTKEQVVRVFLNWKSAAAEQDQIRTYFEALYDAQK